MEGEIAVDIRAETQSIRSFIDIFVPFRRSRDLPQCQIFWPFFNIYRWKFLHTLSVVKTVWVSARYQIPNERKQAYKYYY